MPDMPRVVPVVFRDSFSVRWAVEPRLLDRAPEPLPAGFQFTSEYGERRFLQWDPREFFSPRDVDADEWRALLRAATVET